MATTKKSSQETEKKRTKPKQAKTLQNKNLVIVESPAKAKTIENFLGKSYIVRASNGHLRDLPKSKMAVDVEHDFEPSYTTIRGKAKLIKELKEASAGAKRTYLATDPDREGEAISWHIASLLDLDIADACRIEFHEITKDAVTTAIKNPRCVDMNRVNAQQTRRILDRLVGYQLSPLLWRKVKKGLSAGRVQSVAVKVICDREQEIRDFVPEEFWTIDALLRYDAQTKPVQIQAKYYGKSGKKCRLANEEQALAVVNAVKDAAFIIDKVNVTQKVKNALPPFITSTLQQDATRKLNFTAKKTMMLAQNLYEGIKIGSKTLGLITYMRTDSRRISKEAQAAAAEYIEKTFGKEYVPAKPNIYATSKNAQDAHEAIRPTYIENTPKDMKPYLTGDQYRLYKLIYERYLASQMMQAKIETLSYQFEANGHQFRASGSRVLFKGHLAVYDSQTAEEKEAMLPYIEKGEALKPVDITPKQNFTQPPARYNEASLIKFLEERGIGRPSTYAPIISTIQDRGYVYKENKAFYPSDLGEIVTKLMSENFADIVDVAFTADMENKLDSVENNGADWHKILRDFYDPFEAELKAAEEKIERVQLPQKVSDVQCEKCGAMMVYKQGRYGEFLACPNFPECRNTKAIVKAIDTPCPNCGGRIIIKKGGKSKKTFYGCENYPECDFVSWNMPLAEKCPECGSYMVQIGKSTKRCSNDACITNAKRAKK